MFWENKGFGVYVFDSRRCDYIMYVFLIMFDIIRLINLVWGLIRFNYGW